MSGQAVFRPDLLTFSDGRAVKSPEQWPARRRELIEILEREQYGIAPEYEGHTRGYVQDADDACGGRGVLETVSVTFPTPAGPFSFPIRFIRPTDGKAHPLMLLLNFRREVYDRYCPAEEIIDNGFALAVLCYSDITSDDADMTSGIAACYPRTDPATDWGKLSMWAFGASRALDYLLTRPEVDPARVCVIGHSRLGKAALLCGAKDERVRFTFSNDSGCGGAALEQTKHPGGETYTAMAEQFPYWFCGNRSKYLSGREMPYDQHFLLAAICPRYAAVGSASEDLWADPRSEQLCCVAASPAWALLGRAGFVGPEGPAGANSHYPDGHIGYHLRQGTHFLSRRDWLCYMAFVKRHGG